MNILVYGAGVIGSIYAARLQESGQNVSILARGQRLQNIHGHGILLEDVLTGRTTTTRVNVVAQLEPDEAYDFVVVVMGKNQVSAILPLLAASNRTPNVLFLHMQLLPPARSNNSSMKSERSPVLHLFPLPLWIGYTGTWTQLFLLFRCSASSILAENHSSL